MLPALLTTILFATSVMCGHRSSKLLGGMEANLWRVLTALVMLAAYAFTLGGGISGRSFPMFLLSGLIGIGIGDVAFFQALPRLGPRLCSLLAQCLGAPVGALIEWLWLGTTLGLWQILFALLALVGVGIALAPKGEKAHSKRDLAIGSLFALLAGTGNAFGSVLSRKAYAIAADTGLSVDGGTAAFQRVLGGVLVCGLAFMLARRHSLLRAAGDPEFSLVNSAVGRWRKAGPWIMANSISGQTLGVTCMQWALQTTPTGIVLAIVSLTPILVIPFAFVLEGERPKLLSVIGGVIAVAGVLGLVLVKHS